MPDPTCSHETGCNRRKHYCAKGFPERTLIIRDVRAISGKSDYRVLRYAIKRFNISGTNSRTKFAIFTGDRKFWRSAKHAYDSLNGEKPEDIKFTVTNRVRGIFKRGRRTKNISIRIEYIQRPKKKEVPKKGTRSSRPVKVLKRRILRRLIARAESILT